MVAKFLKVTADANAMWADEANHAKMLPVIAKDAGMDEDATMATISTFTFPTTDDQLSGAWLGGNAQTFMKGVADVFVNAGSLDAEVDATFAEPLLAVSDLVAITTGASSRMARLRCCSL